MKLLSALCTVSLLAAMPLPAQEPADTATDPAASAPAPADAAAPAAPQQPAVAEPTLDLMPAQPSPALPVPGAVGSEPSLIPEAPVPGERPRGSAIEPPRPGGRKAEEKKEKKSSTELFTGELQQRIRFRQAKTRALGEPAIQAEWRKAEEARTDFERRAALKRYYTLLFSRMGRLDASLKIDLAERQRLAIRRLEQKRIEPTEQPLEFSERTAPLEQDQE